MKKPKFWQTNDFKALDSQWREILEMSGFEDAEDERGRLKQRASNSYRAAAREARENKERYFSLLGAWIHREQFQDELERFVMERRSQGAKIIQISRELKARQRRKWCRDLIRAIIQKYEGKWGIRKKPPTT